MSANGIWGGCSDPAHIQTQAAIAVFGSLLEWGMHLGDSQSTQKTWHWRVALGRSLGQHWSFSAHASKSSPHNCNISEQVTIYPNNISNIGERATQSCRAASLCAAAPYSCRWLPHTTRPGTHSPPPLALPRPGAWAWGSKEPGCPNVKKDSWEWGELGHGASLPVLSICLRREEGLGLASSPPPLVSLLSAPTGDFQATSPCPQCSEKVKAAKGALFGRPWLQQPSQSSKAIQP